MSPSFSLNGFRLTLRGLDRKLKHLPRQALPITINILDKFHQFLDMNNPCDITFWCGHSEKRKLPIMVSVTNTFLVF
jgi:hypothetical protein